MARTAVTINYSTTGGAVTATVADPTNDHVLELGNTPLEDVVIVFANTNGSDRVATILAGDNPPALSAGQGDLAITVPATSGVMCVTNLESARYLQSDGTVNIDLAASFDGTVTAYRTR